MGLKNSVFLKWLNILAFLLTVLFNGLAGSTTILAGKSTAQVSDANPTLITPAGYVFSIWGIIYILLGIFVFFQALPGEKGKSFHRKINFLFALSCLLNIVWLFLWQFEYLGLSVIIMFLLLATLLAIYLRLEIGKSTVQLREKLSVHLPFSVYLGWITIASIANVAATLVSINWNGFGIIPEIWATIVLIVALLITLFVIFTRKDVAYGMVIIWGLVGIAMKQIENQSIVMVTEISAIIIAVVLTTVTLLTIFKCL